MFSEILAKMESAIDELVTLIRQGYTLSNALSGGKDSTCTAILMLEAVRRAGTDVSREHFVTSADTTIENPSMHWHLQAMLDEIRDAYADAGASVSVHVAKPSLASQFVVATIGRGTLPRTPENGVKNGKRIRACAADWKVDPQNRPARHARAFGGRRRKKRSRHHPRQPVRGKRQSRKGHGRSQRECAETRSERGRISHVFADRRVVHRLRMDDALALRRGFRPFLSVARVQRVDPASVGSIPRGERGDMRCDSGGGRRACRVLVSIRVRVLLRERRARSLDGVDGEGS
ncbi:MULTISPECIES: hypothetical protein [unclassified Burkholderia]|uniref:hypothetical protein n=1 Tax=unclassified Burkholderia TaxID=2613784 RepID=UPI002AB01AB1|nr:MULTISPECIES: hypothetical protein [unclassified Burkholderia]